MGENEGGRGEVVGEGEKEPRPPPESRDLLGSAVPPL